MTKVMTRNRIASGAAPASPPAGISRVQAGPADRKPRILVAHASVHGSTAGVAHAIGDALAGLAMRVEVKPMAEVDDPSCYDAVIAGSAIRYDKWLPEATGFVERHGAVLAKRPLALFFVCMTLSRPGEAAMRQADVYAQNLRTRFANLDPGPVGDLPVHSTTRDCQCLRARQRGCCSQRLAPSQAITATGGRSKPGQSRSRMTRPSGR